MTRGNINHNAIPAGVLARPWRPIVHAWFILALGALCGVAACATVAPVSVRVTGAVKRIKVGAVLPPRFSWPVSGVEVWSAIHHTMNGISGPTRLALVDPREVSVPKDKILSIESFWSETNLPALAERMRLKRGQLLLIEPVIERRSKQVKVKSGKNVIFAKAADYIVQLKLAVGAQPVGAITVRRSLSALDLAVLDDDMEIWVDALREATGLLTNELKGYGIYQIVAPTGMREGLASMASTSLPGLTSPIAIPDTLKRLTEIDRLTRAAGLKLTGAEIEAGLQQQPGIRVTADQGLLKKGDLIITAEEHPTRNPLALARLRYFGTVHLEVLRGGALITLILEPQ